MPVTEGRVWGGWSGKGPIGGLPPKPKLTPRTKSKEEWALLAKYDQLEDFKKAEDMKRRAAKSKAEMRAYLADQVAARDSATRAEREADLSWSKVFDVRGPLPTDLAPPHTPFPFPTRPRLRPVTLLRSCLLPRRPRRRPPTPMRSVRSRPARTANYGTSSCARSRWRCVSPGLSALPRVLHPSPASASHGLPRLLPASSLAVPCQEARTRAEG